MTDEEAEVMLKQLSEHFKEPVQPIGRYCAGLRLWRTAIHERVDRLRNKLFPDGFTEPENYKVYQDWRSSKEDPTFEHGDLRRDMKFASEIDHVYLMIQKSNLLARVLYGGQPVRTEMCPEHKGKWSGIDCCPHGCDETGWLPTEEMLAAHTKESWEETVASCERSLSFRPDKKTEEYLVWVRAQLAKRFP